MLCSVFLVQTEREIKQEEMETEEKLQAKRKFRTEKYRRGNKVEAVEKCGIREESKGKKEKEMSMLHLNLWPQSACQLFL